MAIDTDDLTSKTYKAILAEAGRFHEDLMLQFGLLSAHCDDEAEFIKSSQELAREMLTYDEVDMADIFFDNMPSRKDFHAAVNRILENIRRLVK